MATGSVPTWSTTAASNSTADPAVNWAEGMAPSAINDSARAMMASVAKWRDDISGSTAGLSTGGNSTAYTVTTNSTFATAAAMSGALLTIIPHTTSGASPTLAVDGLTARAINQSTGVAIATGGLISGTPYLLKYVHASTEFILVGRSNVFTDLTTTSTATLGGVARGADGTKTAPEYSFTSDTDTGIYRIGANNLGVSCGDTKIVDVTTSGVSVTGTGTFSSTLTASSGFTMSAGTFTVPAATLKEINPFAKNLLHVQDQKASGTDGGTFTSGAWRTRTLNTSVTNEITGASLASNQITLPEGTYLIEALVAAGAVQEHQLRLYNSTDASAVLTGVNARASNASVVTSGNTATLRGRFTIAAQKVLELQHRCNVSQATTGFGHATSWGTEIYADALIYKVA